MTTTFDYAAKIKALFVKAEDPATSPEEAEDISAKAEELMVKWGIDDAMLADKRRKQKKAAERIVEKRVRFSGPMCRGEVYLGFAVAEGLGLKALKSNGTKAEGTMVQYVYLIGHESDVARAELLLASLQLQCIAARQAWWKGYENRKELSANQAFLAKRQFVIGFATVVLSRLTALRVHTTETVEASTALVLVDRAGQLDDWMDANYPKLKNGRGISWGSGDGHRAGVKAGSEAAVGGSEVGSNEQAKVEA